VRVPGLSKDQQQRSLRMLNRVIEMAHERGLAVVLGLWDHIYRGGVQSGVWMVRDPDYGLGSLQRQFRQQLLRALEREQVRDVGFDELLRLGTAANRESLARLGLADRRLADPVQWERLCRAGAQTPGAGALASFGRDGMTAYLIHFTAGDTCYGLISKSRDAARRSGANHALYFSYAQAMIRRPGIAAVSIGVQSVPPLAGVDRVKRHAGFRLEPFAVAVFLRPAARALVMSAAGDLALRVGAQLFGRSDAIRRTRALRHMIRATGDDVRASSPEQGGQPAGPGERNRV